MKCPICREITISPSLNSLRKNYSLIELFKVLQRLRPAEVHEPVQISLKPIKMIRADEIKQILAGELEFDEHKCMFEVEILSDLLNDQLNQMEAELKLKAS